LLFSGPVAPPPPQRSDDEEDRAWDSDDRQDFDDQLYSLPSPMAHYPGSRNPLVRFLFDVPDWSVLDTAALDKALRGLPVPIPDKNEDKWTAAELNSILINNVVRGAHGHLRTFGGI
jgi:hypothetical protein